MLTGPAAPACAADVPGDRLPAAAAAGPADGEPAPAGTPLQALLGDARRALARGESQLAYERLSAQVARYAGLPDFDYLLGLAALDAGHPSAAVLALERVLAVEPGHLQARAEIARAYLANDEREAARRQFETVAAAGGVPAQARRVIDRYLAAIARAEADAAPNTRVQIEWLAGHDSNVNFGSSSGQWLLADGTAVTPLAASRPNASAVAGFALGVQHQRPLGDDWRLAVGGNLSHRATPSVHAMDQTQLDLTLGVQRKRDRHTVTLQTQFQQLRLDQQAFRNAAGGIVQYQYDADPRTQWGVFAQAFSFGFPDQSVRDARRLIAGATLARALPDTRDTVLLANLYAGRERTRDDLPQLDFDLRGLRLAASLRLAAGWRGYLSASWETRDYAGAEPLFGVTRSDHQTDLRIGAERPIGRDWVVSPQIAYTRNRSTLQVNDFRRAQALVTARYLF